MQNDFQFYPTPAKLARKAWAKFKNREFVRILEPQAGEGHLLDARPWEDRHHMRTPIDCCELDVGKHAALREKQYAVVGVDFLRFGMSSLYSHIIMNPPFANGAQHVLKAWDVLWDGELVAIVNASTLLNPFSKDRQMLVDLIERQRGEVEYIADAFTGPEVEREASVDVALIYLKKTADYKSEFCDFINDLQRDARTPESMSDDYVAAQELALPHSSIENAVRTFDSAVIAMRHAVKAEASYLHFRSMIGATMGERSGASVNVERENPRIGWVQKQVAERYDDMKDAAWAGILRSTNVTDRLSSKAQRRVEAEFAHIKRLDFTVSNIYGFLCGLVQSQGDIQIGMACDVFDAITRYHSDNTVFYRSWKSNDKHRTCGCRIKTTRFVLPGHGGYSSGLKWESQQLLADFDKVFAMLDGQTEPEISLVDVFTHSLDALQGGERIKATYFDVRYYPGAGTIHFFANNKVVIDRLNRLVGRHRQWLPEEGQRVSDAFWLQYDKAEKFDKEVREEVRKTSGHISSSWGRSPFTVLMWNDAEEQQTASKKVDAAITAVLERHGIETEYRIEAPQKNLLLTAN